VHRNYYEINLFSRRTRLTGPKLGLNLRTTGAVHVTLYRTWHPSDLFTGPHGQVKLSCDKQTKWQTNKQTLLKTSTLLHYATLVGNQTNEFIFKNLTTPKCWVQCILDNSNDMSNTCDSQFQRCVWWILEARYLAAFWLCHRLNKCNDLHLCFYQPYHRFNKQPLFGCHFTRWLAQTGNLLQYFDAFIDLLAKLTRTIFSNLHKTHVNSITAKLHAYQ